MNEKRLAMLKVSHAVVAAGREVRTDDGKIERWQIGGPALNRMEGNGWTQTTVKPGDALTGIGYQFSDGQKIIRLERVVLADGKTMILYGK